MQPHRLVHGVIFNAFVQGGCDLHRFVPCSRLRKRLNQDAYYLGIPFADLPSERHRRCALLVDGPRGQLAQLLDEILIISRHDLLIIDELEQKADIRAIRNK